MRMIFGYELKKIVKRRLVWVSMVLSSLLILVTVGAPLLGSYYVNGERIGSNYEMFQIDKVYQEALNGRAIDTVLLQEMQEAYRKVPLDAEQYSLTEEYQKYARPYSAIFNYVRQTTGMAGTEAIKWIVSTEDLHAKRMERQELRWESFLLTEQEKQFWREQEKKIENPVIFQYTEGYYVLINAVYTIGLLSVFVVAICLADVFPKEHVRKTDQLIHSSKYGKREIYWAKFMAGTLFAFFVSFLFVIITFVAALLLYGAEGFDAAFQLVYAGSSCPISMGEAAIIAYLMVLFAGVFMGVLVMMLSEVFHNSVGTLAIAIGIILLPMFFSVPEEYRLPAQLWSYLPGNFAAVWNIFSVQTIVVFGKVLQAWQVVPVLYTMLGIVFAFGTKRLYQEEE